MRTIAIDDPVAWVSQSVSLSVTHVGCAKTAERIDVLFGLESPGDPRNILLHGGPHPPRQGEGRLDAAFSKLHVLSLLVT